MFDVIVFTQEELIEAIQKNCRTVGLCDNKFKIPLVPDKEYIIIGRSDAEIDCTPSQARAGNIKFIGFEPAYTGTSLSSCLFGSSNIFGEVFNNIYVGGYGINLI